MSNYEQQKAAALEHLEEKYGKTFEIESFTARNMDMPYDLYIMKDAAGNNFSLTVRYAKDGKTEIRDGYYGIAKAAERWGDRRARNRLLRRSILIPMLIHGACDFIATDESPILSILFFVYILIVDIFAYRSLQKYARHDFNLE